MFKIRREIVNKKRLLELVNLSKLVLVKDYNKSDKEEEVKLLLN